MTLPTSGPLTFANIQTEFGGSNPIGINEYYAGGAYVAAGTTGTYGAVPSSGQISVQNFYGTSAFIPTGWISLLSSSTYDYANAGAVDSSGNVYAFGTVNYTNFQLVKCNNDGAIQWQRRLAFSPEGDGQSVKVDSSGNVYVFGTSSDGVSNDFQVAKYNSSGTIQFQRRLGNTTSIEYGRAVALDSSANIYVCGYSNIGGLEYFQVAKYDSSGSLQWQRTLDNSISMQGQGISVDSSGNVLVVGRSFSLSPNSNNIQLVKYDSSGNVQWQKRLRSNGSDIGYAVSSDSSNNVYICGDAPGPNGSDAFLIAKYNSSGTLQWQRSLSSTNTANARSIVVDSSSNVYVCGYATDVTQAVNYVHIAKYNSSGTIQWQRQLGNNSVNFGRGIAVDSSNKIYVFGSTRATGTDNFFFAKLPNDGTPTGTYTLAGYTFTYTASILTDASSSLADETTSFSAGTSSLANTVSTWTDSASTLPSAVTPI
jgi:uncharacterized delta-60 repeat protein